MNKTRKMAKISYFKLVRGVAVAVAAVCLLFTGLVNGSTAFAASVKDLPVIGKLAGLVNFRSYLEQTEDYAISVSVPAVIENGSQNSSNSNALNAEILKICEQYAADAKARALEYREAFLETGGTEEEWAEHDITITVDYELKSESGDYLSFVIYGHENWLSSESATYYYNLNVNTMEYVTLEELLGKDYINLVNRQIREQIEERQANNEVFFTREEGGFESISEEQNFYINNAGNVVIVFGKYEIAPGSMGNVEFEIIAS